MVLSQKYERGEVKTGGLNSFHACLSELMFPGSISSQDGHFEQIHGRTSRSVCSLHAQKNKVVNDGPLLG